MEEQANPGREEHFRLGGQDGRHDLHLVLGRGVGEGRRSRGGPGSEALTPLPSFQSPSSTYFISLSPSHTHRHTHTHTTYIFFPFLIPFFYIVVPSLLSSLSFILTPLVPWPLLFLSSLCLASLLLFSIPFHRPLLCFAWTILPSLVSPLVDSQTHRLVFLQLKETWRTSSPTTDDIPPTGPLTQCMGTKGLLLHPVDGARE